MVWSHWGAAVAVAAVNTEYVGGGVMRFEMQWVFSSTSLHGKKPLVEMLPCANKTDTLLLGLLIFKPSFAILLAPAVFLFLNGIQVHQFCWPWFIYLFIFLDWIKSNVSSYATPNYKYAQQRNDCHSYWTK